MERAWTGSTPGVFEEQQGFQGGWSEAREGQAGSVQTAAQAVHCTAQEGAAHMHHSALRRTQSAQILTRPWGGR